MLVDVLSGYSEVFRFLLPPTSATIIHKVKDFWNSTVWPVVFCSDGEPNLDSEDISEFLVDNNMVADSDLIGISQREYDIAADCGEGTSRAEAAFLPVALIAGHSGRHHSLLQGAPTGS